MQQADDQVTELIDILSIMIIEKSEGFSEHQLLTLLQNPPYRFFAKDALKDPLVLFQTHFLLFHCLYQLRERWRHEKVGLLEISALSIIMHPLNVNAPKVEKTPDHALDQNILISDPLAQYYLDWSHFTSTNSEDVETLLSSFWKKVFVPVATESLQQALIIMELESPIPTSDLKVQYRRLAQRYHPDKGGDSERFKSICQAFHQLKHHNSFA